MPPSTGLQNFDTVSIYKSTMLYKPEASSTSSPREKLKCHMLGEIRVIMRSGKLCALVYFETGR
jgi:hypothetical protein